MGLGAMLLIGLIVLAMYCLPLGVALLRGHPQTASIAVINLCLGWSIIVWVVALAMAVSAIPKRGEAPPPRPRQGENLPPPRGGDLPHAIDFFLVAH